MRSWQDDSSGERDFIRGCRSRADGNPDAASISRVALLHVASTTHATRFDERFVDLSFTAGDGQIAATAPASGNYAPPGYYYLDLLSAGGVPAVMPFVLVTPTPVRP